MPTTCTLTVLSLCFGYKENLIIHLQYFNLNISPKSVSEYCFEDLFLIHMFSLWISFWLFVSFLIHILCWIFYVLCWSIHMLNPYFQHFHCGHNYSHVEMDTTLPWIWQSNIFSDDSAPSYPEARKCNPQGGVKCLNMIWRFNNLATCAVVLTWAHSKCLVDQSDCLAETASCTGPDN